MTMSRLGQGCILALALSAFAVASPEQAPQQGESTSPDVGLPKATNGVLPPGTADKVLPVGGNPIVKLIEPGAEPRADLSYGFENGTSKKILMTMDLSVAVKTRGQSMAANSMPRMSMGMTVATTEKNDSGDFKIDSLLTTTSVDPSGEQQEQMAKALRPQLEAMKGLSVTYWANAKGHLHDVKLGIPQSVTPAAKQLLNGMSQSFESQLIPLPVEPLGVGGKWQVISRVATGGADILQSAVYTLKEREGNRATLEVKTVQLVANDTIRTEQMPQGMSAKVKTFQSAGSGTNKLDLKSVALEGGTMTLKTTMDLTVQGPGLGAGEESTVETTTTVQTTRP